MDCIAKMIAECDGDEGAAATCAMMRAAASGEAIVSFFAAVIITA
jgi:hypothetical protein